MEKNLSKDTVIRIEFHDSYTHHLGLRDESSTYWPEDANPGVSYSLIKSIKEEAGKLDAEISEDTKSYEPPVKKQYFDMGFDIEYIEYLKILFGSGGALLAYLKVIRPIIVQWMKNRAGRSAEVEVGDIKVKIKGSNDVDKVITLLEKAREKH